MFNRNTHIGAHAITLHMKRSSIIRLTILVYIVAMIGMFIGVDQYIKSKDNRLRWDMHSKVDEIFKGKKQFVDIAYSGYKVGYEKIAIPSKPEPSNWQDEESKKLIGDIDEKMLDTWAKDYGDLTRLYRIHYKRTDWTDPYGYEDGWNLVILEHDWEGVYQKWIFPYAVGYRRQEYQWLNSYMPSIDSAVDEALDFYTKNEDSQYYGTFEKGSLDKVWSEIRDAENEYYYMSADAYPRIQTSGFPLFGEYPDDRKPHSCSNGYMYNGYYKVFIGQTQPKTWTIEKWSWNPDIQDKHNLWLYWSIGLTALLLLAVIPLCIIDRKRTKIKEESLYDKLKRLCNPVNFINNGKYDKEIVDKANGIYNQLMNINSEDIAALNELQKQAVTELHINLIDDEKLSDLKEKVNPKNFMAPYNPDKVALANELFAILTKEDLTYDEMAEVEEKSKQL